MRKVCIVVASRANYGRIKSVLSALQKRDDVELQLIVSASALLYRFGSAVDFIEKDGFEISAKLHCVVEGDSPSVMAKSVGLAIIELTNLFELLKPDVVVTVADRYETMATAIAASYLNIPLAHTQGGEKTGSIDESVRHAITRLAHLHFPASTQSYERLIAMGEDPSTVYNFGCPALDPLQVISSTKMPKNILSTLPGTGTILKDDLPFLMVLLHPVTTNYETIETEISEVVEAVLSRTEQVVWLWPNVDAGSEKISKKIRQLKEAAGRKSNFKVRFVRNVAVEIYNHLLNHTACLIGNSSSGIREGAFLGTPVVNVGERQADRERGENVIDVDGGVDQLCEAIKKQVLHGKYESDDRFGNGCAGDSIAKVLATAHLSHKKRLLL